jgi:hypothetical protein
MHHHEHAFGSLYLDSNKRKKEKEKKIMMIDSFIMIEKFKQ